MIEEDTHGRYVKITEDWIRMLKQMREPSAELCADFFFACADYACGNTGVPDYTSHPEWVEFWMRTRVRKADKDNNHPGRIDVNKLTPSKKAVRDAQRTIRRVISPEWTLADEEFSIEEFSIDEIKLEDYGQ